MSRTTQVLLLVGLIVFGPVFLWLGIAFLPYDHDYRRLCGSAMFLAGLLSLLLSVWLPGVRTALGLAFVLLGTGFLSSNALWEVAIGGITQCASGLTVVLKCHEPESTSFASTQSSLFPIPIAAWIAINALLLMNRAHWQAFVGANLAYIAVFQLLGTVSFSLLRSLH